MKDTFFILLAVATITFASSCAKTVNDTPQDTTNSENVSNIETNTSGEGNENEVVADDPDKAIEVKEPEKAGESAPEPATITTTEQSVEIRINEIAVIARTWEFNPSVITVKLNQPVRLSITSVDVAHGFSLPEFGINRDLEPGKTEVIDFTPNKVGSFPFTCSVFCGEGHRNMTGTVVVTPES
jgi:cytochrome c oxidase subunit 2